MKIERQPDSCFPWNSARHFETGQEVEVPAADEVWDGWRAVAGARFSWNAGTERGTSATDLNSLAAIQKIQQEIAAQHRVNAEGRAALYAREAADLERRRASASAREGERRRLLSATSDVVPGFDGTREVE